MNKLDYINSIQNSDEKTTAAQNKQQAKTVANLNNQISEQQFSDEAAKLGINSYTLQLFFNHTDSDHDGVITKLERDNAISALEARLTQLNDITEGEIGDEANAAYEDQQDNQASVKLLLEQLANENSNKQMAKQFTYLIDKLQTEGLSKDVVQKTVELITQVAPPININV